MPATYVTEAELRSALGIGALYSSAVVEECCQAAENIVKTKLWFNTASVVATELTDNVATLYTNVPHQFSIGQTVTVTHSGATFNGSHTITDTKQYKISYALVAANQIKFEVQPVGTITAPNTYHNYAALPEVNLASLMIAVDIWQARQASNAGGISPDFQPSPYRMGNTLMARVRGLLADHLAPGGQVG
jgi:hypothetical protein